MHGPMYHTQMGGSQYSGLKNKINYWLDHGIRAFDIRVRLTYDTSNHLNFDPPTGNDAFKNVKAASYFEILGPHIATEMNVYDLLVIINDWLGGSMEMCVVVFRAYGHPTGKSNDKWSGLLREMLVKVFGKRLYAATNVPRLGEVMLETESDWLNIENVLIGKSYEIMKPGQ